MFEMHKATRYALRLFLITFFVIGTSRIAKSDPFTVTITIDENGHGLFTNSNGFASALAFTLQNDPGPGGLGNAVTYSLLNPPGLTAGDLVLTESGVISDIIRFNPNETCSGSTGCLGFYSDKSDGVDSLADIGFSTALYANNLTFLETGLEGNNGFTYTPLAGQPGFVAGAAGPVTYVIQSDVPSAAVPEPSTILLVGTGLSAVIIVCRKRVRTAL
jgi:hypothetical protein